jgi:hypothetical protein
MELVPWVGTTQLTASSVEVRVDPEDRRRVKEMLERWSAITVVNDDATFHAAKQAAGEVKALIDEVKASKAAAKQPFRAVATSIDNLAAEVGGPVEEESKRILSLLNSYVARLEAKQKAEEKARAEADRKRQEAFDLKLAEAAKRAADAELEARKATDEAARLRAQKDAAERQLALAQAQLERDMSDELAQLGNNKPKPSLVPGGRVDHPLKFELINVQETCDARHYRLLRWTLDIRACQDACRSQLEQYPDREPTLPGIKVTRDISVSVKASARTS